MIVRDTMTSPVTTIRADTKVAEIARLMLEHHLSGLPVVDENGHLLGLVTERDVVAKHARVHLPTYFAILGTWLPLETRRTDEDMRHVLAVTARDLMESHPVTVTSATGIDDVASLMVDKGANPIPVVDDGRLVGVVGHADIIRILLHEEIDGQ